MGVHNITEPTVGMRFPRPLALLTLLLLLLAPDSARVVTAQNGTVQNGTASMRALPEPVDYLALAKGNIWEYDVIHEVDGVRTAPTALRFAIRDVRTGQGAFTDYFVTVTVFDGEDVIRSTECMFRTSGEKPFLVGTRRIDRPDCVFQSPLMATDVEPVMTLSTLAIGQSSVPVSHTGVFEQFWSNERGESGYVKSSYAPGLSLYRYEKRNAPSISNPDQPRISYVSTLVHARTNGTSFGQPLAPNRPQRNDLIF